MHRFNTGTENRVQMAAHRVIQHVFKYGGNIGTYLIMGGVDVKGPQLIEVTGDGNSFAAPYLTLGSGSLSAMAVMETNYKDNMTEQEAKDLCIRSIEAGIYYDLGSGSNVDVIVIKKGKTEYFRNIKSDNHKMFAKPDGYKFKKERVQVLEEYRKKLVVENVEIPMEM